MVTVEANLSTLARGLHAPDIYFPASQKALRPNPEAIKTLAYPVLLDLVDPSCIYASTHKGNEGMYHARFGRDGVVAEGLILDGVIAASRRFGSVSIQDQELLANAISGMLALGAYQATEDVPERGQRRGQLPHEVRITDHSHLTQPIEGQKPWYRNGREMINYDSVDVTPAWAYQVGRLINLGLIEPSEEELSQLREALEWTITNMRENGGFVGFTYNPDRKYGGLRNQNWMDSEFSMRHQDGRSQVFPMRPVEVQGMAWGAFKQAEPIFQDKDPKFAAQIHFAASAIKDRFNSERHGFVFEESNSGYFLAESIDGDGKQVRNITCNPGFLLWTSYGGETIIDGKKLEKAVVTKLMSQEMYDREAGLRTYSENTKVFFDPYAYHNGPNTYWPFVSGLVASGLDELGYGREAEKLAVSFTGAVEKFGSCIETFQRKGADFVRFRDAETGQTSSTDQAWTAAAAYYAHHRFLK